jgi:hypothetical protein
VLGVPDKVIQTILRHANVSTTATGYVKTRDDQTAQAMAKLEDAMPEILTVHLSVNAFLKSAAILYRYLVRFQCVEMVAPGRFELPTSGLGNRCSIHLSYGAIDSK